MTDPVQPPAADLREALSRIAIGQSFTEAESEEIFGRIVAGDVSPLQVAALLMGLRVRGETVEELTGAVRALRGRMTRIQAPKGAMDVCGTGGDGALSWNISTAVALVVAACGVPVAKHGNRAISSRSGGADVLAALGVKVDTDPALTQQMLNDVGFAFLLAPAHHAAMANVGEIRRTLGVRTVFNLLGPLSNPAGVERQLIGVYDRRWAQPVAEVLQRLGTTSAWVVHGSDGMDEITLSGETLVVQLKDGQITNFTISPDDVGLSRADPARLKGGDPQENAAALRGLLDGEPGPYRDIVLLNAAAALVVAGQAQDVRDGLEWARRAIDNGAAHSVLARLVSLSGGAQAA